MKKLFAIALLAGFITACGDNATTDATSTADSATTPAVTETPAPAASTDSTMKDGLMTMKDGKMMIVKNGAWEAMTTEVTCTNGRKVSTTGEVSKGGKKRMLTEGMMIDNDGQIRDKDGKLLDTTGWE